MPNKRKINDNELGYRERNGGEAGSEKLILDQNNKTEYMVHYKVLKFYVKLSIKSYPHNRRLYLFKRDLIKKNNTTPVELLIKLGLDECKEALISNILELTINDDRKIIEAAIKLYNDLRSSFTDST